jgi:hypothetical protein
VTVGRGGFYRGVTEGGWAEEGGMGVVPCVRGRGGTQCGGQAAGNGMRPAGAGGRWHRRATRARARGQGRPGRLPGWAPTQCRAVAV